MIRDRIAVTQPTRVMIGIDRDDQTVKRASVVDELVAEWWVAEGAELEVPEWIRHGVEHQGWKLTRHAAAHVVPEVEGEVGGPNWQFTANRIAEMLREGSVQEALDLHEVASLQQAMVDAPEAHTHDFGDDPEPDTECGHPGCRLRHEDRP